MTGILVLFGLACAATCAAAWDWWRQVRFARRWRRQIEADVARGYAEGQYAQQHLGYRCEDFWRQSAPHPLRHPCIGEEASRELYEEVMR